MVLSTHHLARRSRYAIGLLTLFSICILCLDIWLRFQIFGSHSHLFWFYLVADVIFLSNTFMTSPPSSIHWGFYIICWVMFSGMCSGEGSSMDSKGSPIFYFRLIRWQGFRNIILLTVLRFQYSAASEFHSISCVMKQKFIDLADYYSTYLDPYYAFARWISVLDIYLNSTEITFRILYVNSIDLVP